MKRVLSFIKKLFRRKKRVLISGKEYGWDEVVIRVNGVPFSGITSVKYEGGRKIVRTITHDQAEMEALQWQLAYRQKQTENL